jgi:hypothetical protein
VYNLYIIISLFSNLLQIHALDATGFLGAAAFFGAGFFAVDDFCKIRNQKYKLLPLERVSLLL